MIVRCVRLVMAIVVFAAATALAACKDVPGADGRYANHDHGNYRPP